MDGKQGSDGQVEGDNHSRSCLRSHGIPGCVCQDPASAIGEWVRALNLRLPDHDLTRILKEAGVAVFQRQWPNASLL